MCLSWWETLVQAHLPLLCFTSVRGCDVCCICRLLYEVLSRYQKQFALAFGGGCRLMIDTCFICDLWEFLIFWPICAVISIHLFMILQGIGFVALIMLVLLCCL